MFMVVVPFGRRLSAKLFLLAPLALFDQPQVD
jgi:hypothetical protein